MSAAVPSSNMRLISVYHGLPRMSNLVILLCIGFMSTAYVFWHGPAAIVNTVQKEPSSAGTGGFGQITNGVRAYPPWNIEFQPQLDHAIPERVHSILSAAPFKSIPLLPLDVSFMDLLFGETTMSDSDTYAFGIMSDQWPEFQANLAGDRQGLKQCQLVSEKEWCVQFQCLLFSSFQVTLHRVDKESNYWTARSCENDNQIRAFKVHKFSERSTSSKITILLPHDLRSYQIALRHSSFMVCDYEGAAAYRKKFAKFYKAKGARDVPESSIVNIAGLRDLLHALRMTPFLCSGSILGWRRECGIIPYTSDFDFCVPISQYNAGLESILRNHAHFKLIRRFGKPSYGLEYTLLDKSKVRIDIFFLYEESDHSWTGGMGPGRMKLKYTTPKITQLCAIDLLGHLFHAACNTDDYILAEYGPDWMKPVHQKDYLWFSSAHSVKQMGRWPDEEAEEVDKTF